MVTMRSEDPSAAGRFDRWREQLAADTVPSVVSGPHAEDSRAVVTPAELGPVLLHVLEFPEVRAVRTPALIRRSGPERYGLGLVTANGLWSAQHDRDCRVGVGDLVLHDSSRPSDSRALPGAGPVTMQMLYLPKAAPPLSPRLLDGLLARRLPAATGMNAILARFLTSVADAVENGEVGEREAERLGEAALDLATAVLAAQVDAREQSEPETRAKALLLRIEAFIELNLGDPDLTPSAIAAHHHISLGYLHRLFQRREQTVAAWIRQRRLERCRADLADPRLRHHPIHAVGARWGFHDPAHFSRAFRTAHGMAPSDYRRQALAACGTVQAR